MKNDDPLLDIFCNSKPVKSLIYIKRNEKPYAKEISDAIDTTYSHAVKMMARLASKGLVASEKNSRKKEYRLTEDGEALASNLESVIETCADIEDQSVEDMLQPDVTPVW